MTFYWVYDMPTWKMVFMITAISVGVTWFGTIFVRPFLRVFFRSQQSANDLISYLLGSHGVYFGILLGLLALSAYQNFTDTDKLVSQEASRLAGLYRDVSSYPEPGRTQLCSLLRKYTRYVIDEAWPLQRQGIIPPGGVQMVSDFQDELMKFEPTTPRLEILHAQTLAQFNTFVESRRLRLHAVNTGIPAIIWYVMLIGAAVNIVLIWLLDMKLIVHLFLGGVISFFLATLIAMTVAMDNPFRGEVSIPPTAFELLYEQYMQDKSTLPSAAERDARDPIKYNS